MKAKCTEEDLESLTEYFNNINDVDCYTLGDVLFGDDDPQEFKTAFEGLKTREQERVVEEMYEANLVEEE